MKAIRLEDVEARLRAEARTIRARDGFSRLLHERCMAALRREGLRGAQAAPARRFGWRRLAVGVGVAAAVAIGAWLMVRTPATPEAPETPMANSGAPGIPENLGTGIDPQVTLSTAGALDERKYAYLDRDAMRLLVFVADQLPEFPQEPAPRAPVEGQPAPK
jgi:hypothetical protein